MDEGIGWLLRGLGFVIGGAAFWLLYFDLKDHLKPEPRKLLLIAFGLGGGAALLGLAAYHGLSLAGAPAPPGGTTSGSILLYCLVVIGPLEEGAKFLVARTIVFRWRHFDERIDGLVYASAVAIGFASIENLLYMPLLGWPMQLARAAVSPVTHSLFAALWGLGTAQALLRARTPGARFAWQAIPLAAAMLLHGLYDFFLLSMEATWLAALIVLSLWLPVIGLARRIVRRRPVQA